MSPLRRVVVRWVAPLALAGAMGGAAVVSGPRSPTATPPSSVLGKQLVAGGGSDAAPFLVAGNVSGLAPGVTRPLHLRLSNPNQGGIAVETLHVAVSGSSAGCSADNLSVGAFAGPVLVPGGGEAQVSLPVTMRDSAPSTCQRATFPLTYEGSAVKA